MCPPHLHVQLNTFMLKRLICLYVVQVIRALFGMRILAFTWTLKKKDTSPVLIVVFIFNLSLSNAVPMANSVLLS